MRKKRTRKEAHKDKSALGKKRTCTGKYTTREIIFISLLNSNKGIRLFTISLCSSKDNYFFYPFVVCDIGRSRPLSL